jgi:hypothetical protein
MQQRLLRCTVLALLFATGVGLHTSPTAAAALAVGASSPLTDATEEIAAQDLAEHFGVSIDDARAQMSRQAGLIGLSQRLAEQIDSTWAGARIDHAHGGTLVVYTTDVTSARAALASDATGYAAFVDVVAVSNTYHELAAIADALRKDLAGAGVVAVGVIVDPTLNEVRVQLPTTGQLAARYLSAVTQYGTAASMAAQYPKTQVSYDGGALDLASCDIVYELCDPPLRGGIEIKSDSGRFCTGGLVVRSTVDSKNYLLTAGHCVDGLSSTDRWYTGFDDRSLHYIGASHNSASPTYDAAILNVDNPGAGGWRLPARSQVYVVASGGTRPTVRDESYDITAVGDNCYCMTGHPIPFDTYLCWTGSTWQTDCGRFDGTSGSLGYLNIDNYGICQGDSGGPVYASGAAYGILHSLRGTTTISTTGWRYFSPGVTVSCAGYGAGRDAVAYQGMGTALRALRVELIP